jgi:succinate dehydrogenase/fumarate reductase-like Fe-S protein
MSGQGTTTVRVRRGGPGDESRFDSWQVPYQEGMSVLDALLWVREHHDPSLAIRFSCVNANACKECVAIVNGKPGYLCTERLSDTAVTCEPLPRKPLIRDLVVDMATKSDR